jgi:hypothetical protein
MFKKIALAMTFLAAFTVAGFSITPTADAQRYWGRPYVNYYWGAPRAYYYGYGYGNYSPRAYRAYYGPRVVVQPYYQPYYNAYYGPGNYYGGTFYR